MGNIFHPCCSAVYNLSLLVKVSIACTSLPPMQRIFLVLQSLSLQPQEKPIIRVGRLLGAQGGTEVISVLGISRSISSSFKSRTTAGKEYRSMFMGHVQSMYLIQSQDFSLQFNRTPISLGSIWIHLSMDLGCMLPTMRPIQRCGALGSPHLQRVL